MTECKDFQIISRLTQPNSSVSTTIQQLSYLTSVSAAFPATSTSGALFMHLDNTWQALIETVVANTGSPQQAVPVEYVHILQQQNSINPARGDQLRFD
jgi:flagellar hook-associated protein FlgK